MDRTNASAIVTGGAGSFGSATMRRLAWTGAKVVIADVSDERGEALAREVGAGSLCLPTDCIDDDAIATAAAGLLPLRAAVQSLSRHGLHIGRTLLATPGRRVPPPVTVDWRERHSQATLGEWDCGLAAPPCARRHRMRAAAASRSSSHRHRSAPPLALPSPPPPAATSSRRSAANPIAPHAPSPLEHVRTSAAPPPWQAVPVKLPPPLNVARQHGPPALPTWTWSTPLSRAPAVPVTSAARPPPTASTATAINPAPWLGAAADWDPEAGG